MLFCKVMALVIALATCAANAEAGSFGRYGVGAFNSAEHSKAETKVFSLGYEDEVIGPMIKQVEAGLWVDATGNGRRSSGFASYSIGVECSPGSLVLRTLWGVGAITSPDAFLGGWFQFNQDLLLGFKDSRGTVFGLNYKHLSSAGIYSPNKGRDFLVVQAEINL